MSKMTNSSFFNLANEKGELCSEDAVTVGAVVASLLSYHQANVGKQRYTDV